MHRLFEHLPQTLQPKVAEYAATTAKKAENICKRNHIAKDTAAAIVADAMDVLAGTFHGLHATYAQMQEVTQKTKRSSWERTDMPALAVVTDYYARITDAVDSGKAIGNNFIDAAVACAVKKHKGQEPTAEDIRHGAHLYYALCVLIVGEDCHATEAELQGIPVTGCVLSDQYRQRCIASALEMQRQQDEMAAAAEKKRRRREERNYHNEHAVLSVSSMIGDGTTLPRVSVVSNPHRTIPHFQNITQVLGGELQTAPVTREGREGALRPLRTAIAERVAIAEQLKEQAKNDSSITAADVQRAQNLITNRESIYHAIDGLHIMTQEQQPTSRTDMATGYTITPHRFAQLATGLPNPSQPQVINIMRALDFLSMERIEVVEEVVKYYPVQDKDGNVERGADGRIKKKPKCIQIYTRFTPANTTFYGEFGEEVPLADAFTMNIQVHRMITKGRSEQYKEVTLDSGKKQKLLVQVPRVNFLQTRQIYDFNSDIGTRFRNILISKAQVIKDGTIKQSAHMAQDKLLAAVFDYGGRLRDAQAKAQEAKAEWEKLEADGTATEEQKVAAKKRAEDAANNATAKRIASKHSDRDIKVLRGMFERAQETGIIRSYFTRPAANARQKANGEWTAVVWEWLRPTKDDINK